MIDTNTDMMKTLFDQETVMRDFLRSERLKHQAEDEARGKATMLSQMQALIKQLNQTGPIRELADALDNIDVRDDSAMEKLYKELGVPMTGERGGEEEGS